MNTPDLLIFGATRNTGLHIARIAKEKGLFVVAMVRPESNIEELVKLGVTLIEGDAFSMADCQNVFEKYQPKNIVTTLGGKDKDGRRIDTIGNMNIIHSVLASRSLSDLKRFVLMTSMGCGEQYETTSEQVKTFLGEALRAKTEVENFIKTTELPWTIVRPCGLSQDKACGYYALLTEKAQIKSAGYLPRADVAQAVLDVLDDDIYLHQAVSIVKPA